MGKRIIISTRCDDEGDGNREVIELLKPLTMDSDPFVRGGAALGIGFAYERLESKKAVEIIKPLVNDEEWPTRLGAMIGIALTY